MSSIFRRHGGKFIAAAVLIGSGFVFPILGSHTPELFRTPGVKNIEDRYSSGGGSKHHLPGAGTRRGNSDDVAPRGDEMNKRSGIGSTEFQEKIAGQKVDPGPFDKAWNKTHYGTEKGK